LKGVRVTLWEIATSLARVTSTQVGGGAGLAIRRELVRNRQWFTEPEYLEILSLAQLAPGPQMCNVAIITGLRLRGTIGAIVAWTATTIPALALLFVIAVVILRGANLPIVAHALRGCAAGAVGLSLANAIELTTPLRAKIRPLIFVAVAAAAGVSHVPLAITLAVLIPCAFVAIALSRR
jgi:chromate transporter